MTHDLSETDRAQWLEWAKRQTVVMPLYCSHGILAFDAKLRAVEDERDALVERLKAAVTGWECKGCRASFFRESSTAARATVLADALQHIASHRLLAHDVVPYASAALARAADAANARAADPSAEPAAVTDHERGWRSAIECAAQIAESYEPRCDTCPRGVASAIRHKLSPKGATQPAAPATVTEQQVDDAVWAFHQRAGYCPPRHAIQAALAAAASAAPEA
jgi:hypothetical protein